MIDLLRLCRLHYSVPLAFAYGLTVCYAAGPGWLDSWGETALSAAALALVVAGAYVLNDVFDADVDKINAPDRAIASGRIGSGLAAWWGVFLIGAGLIAGLGGRWSFWLCLLAIGGLLVAYDCWSKRLGLGKQLVVAVLVTSIYPAAIAQAGGLFGERSMSLVIFPVWFFLTAFGYEILKDLGDVEGDETVNRRPDWIVRFPARARRVAVGAVLAGVLVLPVAYWAGCGVVYLVGACAAVGVGCAVPFVGDGRRLALIYVEVVVVGLGATADLMVGLT